MLLLVRYRCGVWLCARVPPGVFIRRSRWDNKNTRRRKHETLDRYFRDV